VETKTKHILLVDDSEIDNYVNRTFLKLKGVTENITSVTTVDGALSFLRKHQGDDNFPDLILLDINMPVKSGFDFLVEYEKLPTDAISNCEVSVLSSSDKEEDVLAMLSHPLVNHYFVKPLSVDMIDKIRGILMAS
jgi:CheY-like chemotaxis protein